MEMWVSLVSIGIFKRGKFFKKKLPKRVLQAEFNLQPLGKSWRKLNQALTCAIFVLDLASLSSWLLRINNWITWQDAALNGLVRFGLVVLSSQWNARDSPCQRGSEVWFVAVSGSLQIVLPFLSQSKLQTTSWYSKGRINSTGYQYLFSFQKLTKSKYYRGMH